MSAPAIREVDGRLTLEGCDPNVMHEIYGQVLIDLVDRCNAQPPVPRPATDRAWEDVANLVQQAASVSVTRASAEARALSARPAAIGSDVGKDIVSLRFVLAPEDADRLLRWIGNRRGA